ncbi:hypothetical protein [Flammeovirga aprica]|uniref:Uncharacterized protein n=1 Tax=Flammeovirga aprica JL-4 TaxID=694437 RepID=A0A7X9RX48_9BACT|nr:hypothetical protein [Flammeovirga aprica]NME70224.1 hypothetical protein [Flammeovirga aprica JL-4]
MRIKSLIILLLLAIIGQSCDDIPSLPIESHETIYIDVNQGEVIEYDTSIDNFLGAVAITDSTKHHILSRLFSDSTGFNIYHRYQSLKNYQGTDTLKLRSERINDISDEVISIKNITIVLTVK